MKNIFATVKAAITTRQAAETYGLKVSRNGMTCCPFHDDRHPSMKVDERYYCFGCHETGDVIDFTARLFGLTPYEAAQKLAHDFHLDPNSPAPAVQKVIRRKSADPQEAECIGILIDYERQLHRWQETYAPASPEADLDVRFVQACHDLPETTWLVDTFFQPDAETRKQLAEELIQDGTIARLKEKLGKEAAHHEHECTRAAA